MKNATTGKSTKSILAGLTTLEVVFYICSFPIIVILAAVFGYEAYQLVPYYSFWPFVGTILAGVFTLIFFIVVLIVSRKKSKRSIRSQTVSIMITVIILTAVVGMALDVVLPDLLKSLTSNTLFYQDIVNEYDEQAKFNQSIDHKFFMLNIFNGNYDSKYYYENLKNNEKVQAYQSEYESKFLNMTKEYYENNYLPQLDPLLVELFDFVYNSWILTDYAYALKMPSDFGMNVERASLGYAMAAYVLPEYQKIVKEGFNNERMNYLFVNNYASLQSDGYVTFDDPYILYATTQRMTVPVVVRLILNDGYTYSDGAKATLNESKTDVVIPTDAYFFELYHMKATFDALSAANAIDWTVSGDKGVVNANVKDAVINKGTEKDPVWVSLGGVAEGAVIIPVRDGDIVTGCYVKQPMKWGILDMDGKNMDVATIDNLTIDLSGIAPDLGLGELNIAELLDLVNNVTGNLVGNLLDGLREVINDATGDRGLTLGVFINDDGALQIAVRPLSVERGLLGYQYMTWMQSNNLLFAVMSVMSLRNWFFIFGAVSILMVFAAGCCREFKKRIKEDAAAYQAEAAQSAANGAEPAAEPAAATAAATAATPETNVVADAADVPEAAYGEDAEGGEE